MGLKDILKGNAGEVIGNILDKGTTLIDEVVTSKEEAAQLKTNFAKMLQDHQFKMEQEITSRHQADMNSDSWLSKNIRPLTLIFLLVLYTLFSMTDGNIGTFNVTDSYVSLLGEWGMLVMSWYFGGRTIEKVMNKINLIRDKKEK